MDILIILIVAILSVGIGILLGHFVWKLPLDNHAEEENKQLSLELLRAREENNKLSERGKSSFVQITKLEEQTKSLQERLTDSQQKNTRYESESEQRQKDHKKLIEDLEHSRQTLEDEKKRIRHEDEERQRLEEENRNRIWNEHENIAISKMKEVCQKPDLGFPFYENTNLPNNFDGSFKPDFLIEFLGQYIIFDAKMSRSADLQSYLNTQVKNTVKKIKESSHQDEIYPTIFFIVPTLDIQTLKQLSYFEDGFQFFVIPTESFEPILASLKRLQSYDLAESFDPQERENIINLIAAFDQHISRQNAINLLTSIEGLKIMHGKSSLDPEIQGEIEVKKHKMRITKLRDNDLKRLIQNPEEQIKEISQLIAPKKAEIGKDDFEEAQELLK